MAERLHELKQTTSTVQLRGVITGTKSNRFYKSAPVRMVAHGMQLKWV